MTPRRRARRILYSAGPVLLLLAACRESAPPRSHYRDLGSDGMVLLPTASARCDPAVAKGQADWYPFRKLDLSKPPKEEAQAGAESEEGGEIAEEIQGFLEEYNAAAAADDIDDWLSYFEEEEALRPLFETSKRATAKLGELRKQLEAKIPDSKERIAAACDSLAADAGLEVTVQSLKVINDEEATADGFNGSRRFPIRFLVVEDRWFIKVPTGGESSFVTKAALDQALAAFDRWSEALGADATQAENVLREAEAAAKAVEAKRPKTAPRPTKEGDEKGGPEGDSTGDEEPDDQGGDSGGG